MAAWEVLTLLAGVRIPEGLNAEMAKWHTRPPQKQLFAGSSPALRTTFGPSEPLGLSFDSPDLGPSGHPALAITPHAHVSPCQHAP